YDLRAFALQRQPGSDVSLMIEIGHDDFATVFQRLAYGQADQAHERSRVHAEGDFVGMARVDQQRHALSIARDGFVDLLRLAVAPASLHVAMKKMISHRIQHAFGRLSAGRIVEKDKLTLERGKRAPNLVHRKIWHGSPS